MASLLKSALGLESKPAGSPVALNIMVGEEVVADCKVYHGTLNNGSVTLHFVQCGPAAGPLVILLHGFPSFWLTWKYQLGPLSAAGFHVVAPDMRGYNYSSKPSGLVNYSREALCSDVNAIINHFSPDRPASLVGHDWGGNVAWTFAHDYPERVYKLAILNSPHPSSFAAALKGNVQQMRRSWYMFLFQLPGFGETYLKMNNYEKLRGILSDMSTKPVSEEDIERHVEAYAIPGVLTATLDYYRALLTGGQWKSPSHSKTKLEMPVFLIWGEKDDAFIDELGYIPEDVVLNGHTLRLPMASHWVMWDEREVVNRTLINFLKEDHVTAAANSRL
eukprot:SM000006S19414  [mRNA]  locus=s6:678725:681312:+ [translate_table: standard]